ncbi:MAG: hypothetical protein IT318_04650 [Anaerolineales bacterium]|nr:hypothetical protein [Anaerolineales bacterium]
MSDAPRKYYLINTTQLQAARKHWPQVSDKTWVLILKRAEEPVVLNKPPHRGVGFVSLKAPAETVEGMFYRRDIDVLILVSGETPLEH